MQLFANNISVFINQSISSVATSIILDDASKLPVTSDVDQYFTITFFQSNSDIESNWEVVKVTSVTGNTVTCSRGFDGTTAREWSAGASGQMRATAGALLALQAGAKAANDGLGGKVSYDELSAPSGVGLVGGLISTDVTLHVPSGYATIHGAINYLASRRIVSGAIATIQVADGTHVLTDAINCNHPDGSSIRLIGNETTPANCVLSVVGSGFDCLVVTGGHTLGHLNGFKFNKTVKATFSDNSTAILAHNGSTIICGTKIVVNNWYYGIAARNGSFIYAPSASVSNAGDVGVWAFVGSTIEAPNAISNNASDAANGWGFGFQAECGSELNCTGASATGCLIGGIASLSNSSVRAHSSTANNNTGSGFFVRDGGTIEAHSSTANNNTRYGIESMSEGRVYFNAFTATGNAIANISPSAYFDNGALGARIVANGGDLRIDTDGANSMYFNSSGGAQFGVKHTSIAVSYLQAAGAQAGSSPTIQSNGAAANIDASLMGKGAGAVLLGGSQANYLRIMGSTTGMGVIVASEGSDANVDMSIKAKGSGSVFLANHKSNYLRVNSQSTGTSPQLMPEGADANLDLRLSGKGSGVVSLGAFTANGAAVVAGYITIKDESGVVRKLMVSA